MIEIVGSRLVMGVLALLARYTALKYLNHIDYKFGHVREVGIEATTC